MYYIFNLLFTYYFLYILTIVVVFVLHSEKSIVCFREN